MTNLSFDLTAKGGKIKFMNAVNNGPVLGQTARSPSNFEDYKAAHISYARNHDASFFAGYSGDHIVDVHRIFKNFDADENDPASYLFDPTDKYLNDTINAGTKIFYRLGASIEHGYKFGTYPPKDFEKWARICEHIIMHYNEGWADGFHMDIEYWEIWNEPDNYKANGTNPCWQGSEEDFLEFYSVAAKYLKEKFPNLKIGGPAFCTPAGKPFCDKFLKHVAENNIPLDFYSYHRYTDTLEDMENAINSAYDILKKYGLEKAETILNEWNYVKSWSGDEYKYSRKVIKNLKGSSFIAGTMCLGQSLPLDMLMYYDARPTTWNGLFDSDYYEPLKGYYPYPMFYELLKLGTQIPAPYVTDDVYTCAATDGKNSALMLTYYNDDDSSPAKDVCIELKNIKPNSKITYYLLDEIHNNEVIREETFMADTLKTYIKMDLFTTYIIKIEEI